MSIPRFHGYKLPMLLKDAEQLDHGEASRKVIVDWMTREMHNFLGMSWGAFYLKDNTKKKRKLNLSVDEEINNHANYAVYLLLLMEEALSRQEYSTKRRAFPQTHQNDRCCNGELAHTIGTRQGTKVSEAVFESCARQEEYQTWNTLIADIL
jgi:hypothetical protein